MQSRQNVKRSVTVDIWHMSVKKFSKQQ